MPWMSRRKVWSLLAAVCLLPSVSRAQTADDFLPTYRIGTSEVRVTFFATDENNRTVENLDRTDFAIVDSDAVIRDFRSLNPSREAALNLVLLIDASGSVASRFLPIAQNVLKLISSPSFRSDDEISIIVFGGTNLSVICAGDCRTDGAERRLLSVRPGGATPLFDALSFAANFVSKRPDRDARRVLLLFSDGNDTYSRAGAKESLNAVVATSSLLYTIDLNRNGNNPRGTAVLQQFADATSGRFLSEPDDKANPMDAILADLRASYVVTYQLPNRTVGFHSVRILPRHNLNLRFHCQRGYSYEEKR
jgi:VWFA-related protein